MKHARVVVLISRNKDNKHIPGFKERNEHLITDKDNDYIKDLLTKFINNGKPNEISRVYVSINNRNSEIVVRELIHDLLDNPTQDLEKIKSKTVRIAQKKETAKTNKWLFDYDDQMNKLDDFITDIKKHTTIDCIHKTPNGASVIVQHGFDTRELLKKWNKVELHRDGMLCLDWGKKIN